MSISASPEDEDDDVAGKVDALEEKLEGKMQAMEEKMDQLLAKVGA